MDLWISLGLIFETAFGLIFEKDGGTSTFQNNAVTITMDAHRLPPLIAVPPTPTRSAQLQASVSPHLLLHLELRPPLAPCDGR